MTQGLLIAALILAIVVGIWAVMDRAWPLLLLAVAVVLIVMSQKPF